METSNTPNAPRLGDRIKSLVWTMAMKPAGQMPMPTIERVNTIKGLVAGWLVEDLTGTSHEE